MTASDFYVSGNRADAGCPVTELKAYAYAGRTELTEIEIPAGTERIGRYAFYNCTNLEKLIFHSDIKDLGAGAFTGCHRVHTLEVTMVPDATPCLKDFLSELPEEMLVILHGDVEARLHFPEFFEDSEENTPARILVIKTYGSGKLYRNCFVHRQLRFEEYDKCFEYAKAQESTAFLIRLAFDRLAFPCRLSEGAAAEYRQYCEAHIRDLWDYLMEEKDVKQLRSYLKVLPPDENMTGELTALAAAKEYVEATPVLMEYRRAHFQKKRKKFTLDF